MNIHKPRNWNAKDGTSHPCSTPVASLGLNWRFHENFSMQGVSLLLLTLPGRHMSPTVISNSIQAGVLNYLYDLFAGSCTEQCWTWTDWPCQRAGIVFSQLRAWAGSIYCSVDRGSLHTPSGLMIQRQIECLQGEKPGKVCVFRINEFLKRKLILLLPWILIINTSTPKGMQYI